MAKARKDSRGRALRKGEVQRNDGRYCYTFTDPLGRRKFIYAPDLMTLREKEKRLMKDQLDGLDLYAAGHATVNDTFDRYISTKYDLRDTTKSNYLYTYDHFIRDTFGRKKLIDIKYSDVLQFYYYLINERGLAVRTLDSIHTLLHPTFQLAVRDDIIRKNPSDGVIREISKKAGKNKGIRHALTVDQQRAFMEYIAEHPIYYHWWPLFTVLLGTGTRIGECLGLQWDDLDFENRIININHSLTYRPTVETGASEMRISLPKTEAGIRTIPMLDVVKMRLRFFVRSRKIPVTTSRLLTECMVSFLRIVSVRFQDHTLSIRQLNALLAAIMQRRFWKRRRKKREPLILPNFSCHILRHTFATRLCEAESNLKVIQSVMGHRNVETTMDIYAEATDRKKQESSENLAAKLDNIF